MISPVKQFSGKSNDSLEYVAEAIVQEKGMRMVGTDILTLRPFFRRYEKKSKIQTLKPVVSLLEGMKCMGKCLGIHPAFMEEYSDYDLLIDRIKSNPFDRNSVVLGPLSKKVMWERVDSLFYDNQSYFITIVERAKNGFYVHDPEGTPYLELDVEELRKNIEAIPVPKLLIHMGKIEKKQISMDEVWCAFLEELKTRIKDVRDDKCAGADGLTLLYGDIGEKIRSSEKMRLYYNFIDIQKANQSIKEGFVWNQMTVVSETMKHQISEKLDQYNLVIGSLLVELIQEDIQKIKKNLLTCAEIEEGMLELYSML